MMLMLRKITGCTPSEACGRQKKRQPFDRCRIAVAVGSNDVEVGAIVSGCALHDKQ